MKKIVLSLSLLLSVSIWAAPQKNSRSIKLENPILSNIDGKQMGINGENVALTKKYQTNILEILLGTNTRDGKVGKYLFEGKKYSAQQLRKIEDKLGEKATPAQHQEIKTALKQMRNDFENISEEFKDIAKSSKSIMAYLIEESCQKRERGSDNLILIWSKSNESEYALFDKHVRTIKDFEIFMTDLYNFLGDLVSSCPIAQQQFRDRLEKFGKIRKILPQLSLTPTQQEKFFKYVQSKLNSLDTNSINLAKVKELYTQSKK